MAELELTRSRDDRRRYELEGVGSLRLEGWGARRATADTGEGAWQFARRGVLKPTVEATDLAGTPRGEFKARGLRRGGTLRWGEREFALRPASAWRERYALVDGERELLLLDGKGWGKRPVKITVEDLAAIEPGLLLFAAYVVRGLAEDAGNASAGVASAG
jgi:hypothetical protein